MTVEFITKQDLQDFRTQLLNDLREIVGTPQEVKAWLKSSEVRKMLKISAGTLQSLRISGNLHPSKIGGTLYYKLEEIQNMLSNSVVKEI